MMHEKRKTNVLVSTKRLKWEINDTCNRLFVHSFKESPRKICINRDTFRQAAFMQSTPAGRDLEFIL